MTKISDEHFKLMYDRVYDELNRGRDWPIKILAFASAAYFALFSVLKLDNNHLQLDCWIKSLFTAILIGFWLLTIKIILTQHLNYLKYRDIQIKLQRSIKIYDWKVDDETIFPDSWKNPIIVSIWSGFFGWFFYASYISIVTLITVILIWQY